MSKQSHLSVRITQEQRDALDRKAFQLGISVGELARKALAQVAAPEPPKRPESRVVRSGVPVSPRDEEIAWLEANVHRLMAEIPGQWVVLEGAGIISQGPEYAQVVAEALRQVSVPFVFRVPFLEDRDVAWIPML